MVSEPFIKRQLRFFLTAPGPCPYLPGKAERKIFTHLTPEEGSQLNDTLTHAGFRRSQGIAYRPACEGCDACLSARIPVADFVETASWKRIRKRNTDLKRQSAPSLATQEQYGLLTHYLDTRHTDGGMNDMAFFDYVAMVEDSPVRTHVMEYRLGGSGAIKGPLVAAALVDVLADGLSLVYSFYASDMPQRSLGTYIILDHIAHAQRMGLPYVYLGYWVESSPKMAYKARFAPLEVLRPGGWEAL